MDRAGDLATRAVEAPRAAGRQLIPAPTRVWRDVGRLYTEAQWRSRRRCPTCQGHRLIACTGCANQTLAWRLVHG